MPITSVPYYLWIGKYICKRGTENMDGNDEFQIQNKSSLSGGERRETESERTSGPSILAVILFSPKLNGGHIGIFLYYAHSHLHS